MPMVTRMVYAALFTGLLLLETSFAAERPEGLLLIAHRGVVTDTLSENSLPALEETIRRGYTHVEVDIRFTKDGHAVCLHDSSLERTTGMEARIHTVTLAELRERVDTNTVPTLDEFCARAAGRIELMPDIKECPPDQREAFGDEIRRVLTGHGLMAGALFIGRKEYVQPGPGEGRVSVGPDLEKIRELAASDTDFADRYFVFGHAVDFTAKNVMEFQSIGLDVIVSINLFHYTSGDPVQRGLDDVQAMLALGVDGLQIDSVYDAGLARE